MVKKLLKNGSWVVLGEVLQKITKLIFAYFVARYMSPEQYGEFSYVVALLALLSVFSLPTSSNSIIQGLKKNHYGTYPYLARLSLKFSCLGSLCFLMYGAYEILVRSNAGVFNLCLISAVFFPFYSGLGHWASAYHGMGDFKRGSMLVSLRLVCVDVFMIAVMLLWNIEYKVGALLIALLACTSIFNIYSYFSLNRALKKKNNTILTGTKEYVLSTSKYAAFNSLANVVDKVIIFNLFSPVDLAIYVIADRVPELIKSTITSVSSVLVVHFAGTASELSASYNRVLNYVGLAVFAALLSVSLTILPHLMELLFTVTYSQSILFAQLLTISIGITAVNTIKFSFIKAKTDKSSFNKITTWMSVVRIIASLVLVPLYGIAGAVASTFIYRIAAVFIVEWQLKKYKV